MSKAARCFILVGLILLCSAIVVRPAVVRASGNQWSTPVLLYQTRDSVVDPTVITDQTGGVHVFWVNRLKAPKPGIATGEIIYTARHGSQWSKPTDVIAMSGVGAPTGAVAGNAMISVFFHGTAGMLFRTSSPVDRATRAAAWNRPLALGPMNDSGEVIVDSHGRLYLVYPGQGSSGVFYQNSDDDGQTWSFPVEVSPPGLNATSDFTRMAVGPDGTIHVVWTEFRLPNGWPPIGVFYSRSTNGGKTWSPALQIAEEGFTQANVAGGPNGTVFIAWNGMSGVQGRYSRLSRDGGKTWSKASVLVVPTNSVGGSSGPPGLVVDAKGVAHVLFTTGGRVWYCYWQGSSWSTPEDVHGGDEGGFPSGDLPVDERTRQIEQPVMALGPDGQLHVVFWDMRPSQNVTYVWYTTKQVYAPADTDKRPFSKQPESMPSTPTPAPTSRSWPSSEPTRSLSLPTQSQRTANGLTSVIIGLIGSGCIVSVTLLFSYARSRR